MACGQDPGLSVMSEMSAEMANAPTVQPVEEPAQAAPLVCVTFGNGLDLCQPVPVRLILREVRLTAKHASPQIDEAVRERLGRQRWRILRVLAIFSWSRRRRRRSNRSVVVVVRSIKNRL